MKKRALAIIAVIALLLVPSASIVQAQQSGQGLEISPVVLDLVDEQVDPGQSIQVNIKVRNVTSETVIAKGQVNDFIADGEGGQPKILLDDQGEPSPYGIESWVQSVPDLQLAPREAKTATVTINVPQDASPGGHYGVVRFTATPVGVDQSGVALSASIGTLVLLNVSGDVVTQGSIEQFFVSQNGKQSTFFEKGPLNFTERINNTGNVHFKPQGNIKVSDTFGREVASLTVNENGGNILPNSIRKFEQNLDKTNMFGRYKAELNLTYGQDQTLNQTITFWVIPYKLVAIVLVGLLLVIFLIVFIIRRYKKKVVKDTQHEDAIKYGHEDSPVQHTPGMVHNPEENDQQQPPQPPNSSPPNQR